MKTLLLAVVLGGDGLDMTASSTRTGQGYELSILGKGGALPEGATVRLRLRRIVHGFDEACGTIVTVPQETARVRTVTVEKGTFSHRETFAGPGEIEVVALHDPLEDEEGSGRPVRVARRVRLGQPIEVAAALRRNARALEEILLMARKRAGVKGMEPCKALESRLGELRRDAESNLLPATTERLLEVIGGAASECGWEAISGLVDLHVRELGLVLLGEARAVFEGRRRPGCTRFSDALGRLEADMRSGPFAPEFAAVTTVEGAALKDLIDRLGDPCDPEASEWIPAARKLELRLRAVR
jgi:hypothetical protein